MHLTTEQIAKICHEANRGIQVAANDPAVSPAWDDAPAWQRGSAIEGVIAVASGTADPVALHDSWAASKVADGWVYGPVKDEAAKTHPCLVAYDELPAIELAKDHVFGAIVRELLALNEIGA